MTYLIDSHVNLHAAAFDPDRAEVIARATDAGVRRMVTVCDKLESFPTVHAIACSHPDIWATVGVHPHHAKDHAELQAETLIKLAAHPRVAAVGETGLDLHYGYSPIDQQLDVFREHIAAARTTGKPLIVHTREADALTAGTLEHEYGRGPFPILMHCYTSGGALARSALALGAYFSFSGIVAFKTADDVRAIARAVPDDRVLLETDCPYLAPPPYRGRRNEPSYIGEVYNFFCQLRGWSLREGADRIADNFHRLFRDIPR